MSQGYSVTATAAYLGVCKDTLYRWVKEKPEFSDAISRGYALGLQYFENLLIGKTNGTKRNVDTSCILFILKTRFHKEYGDLQKHEVSVSQITIKKEDENL
jgi:hypothetical protein